MVLECIEGEPIKLDGTPIMKNLQINSGDNKQVRIKCELIHDGDSEIIDLLLLKYSGIKWGGLSINCSAVLKDMRKDRNISAKIQINPVTGICNVEVTAGYRLINKDINTVEDLLNIVADVLELSFKVNKVNKEYGGSNNDKTMFYRKEGSF